MNLILIGKRGFERFSEPLRSLGYKPFPLEPLPGLDPIVADHADTLIFDGVSELLSAMPLDFGSELRAAVGLDSQVTAYPPFGKYPDDIKLNALALGGYLFGRLDRLSPELIALADRLGLKKVHIRQGYARCSILPLYPDAAVTADRGAARAMREVGIDVLELEPGHIALEGCEYGFIGGASAVDRTERRVIFFGQLDRLEGLGSHPDADAIHAFCKRHGYRVVELPGDLTDIGGGVIVSR